ncbi:hypothetical protein RIR_jg6742.t1 [Rhizophagus irregularis DAOM 181602=DAOM 197198]|uniref:Uncharacterized protein n=1 Tax=Rhizophagus irregularis (strain DAOM 181602 / DAOM 197198 / MUCL 43194) TaxID=747089 RepID=U9TXX1_RHIID|nr:hypothetical protein RIR_jg6742.t1 [Rhizophagus irregularis DAOM 181602=DAOM 197198]
MTRKRKEKRVKGKKHQTKQPPEKAKCVLKLPPTHYSEVYLLTYTPDSVSSFTKGPLQVSSYSKTPQNNKLLGAKTLVTKP